MSSQAIVNYARSMGRKVCGRAQSAEEPPVISLCHFESFALHTA